MLRIPTTLLKKDHLWIFNKKCKQHFNQLLAGHPEENKWKPVHRLDYETSGAICLAREDVADQFTKLFKERRVKKLYLAGASNDLADPPPKSFLLDTSVLSTADHTVHIRGYIASRYRHSTKVKFLLAPNEWYRTNSPVRHSVYDLTDTTLLHTVDPQLTPAVLENIKNSFQGHPYLIHLVTGARHQIRAYFKFMDATLVGDPIYGSSESTQNRMELHSWKMEMHDPIDGKLISVVAPIDS